MINFKIKHTRANSAKEFACIIFLYTALTERSFDVINLSIKLRNFGGIIKN